MLSFVVFKAQWQIICFDKNNEQSSKMIRQGGDRNWQGRLKNMQGLKKKNWRVYKIQSTGVRPRSREELEAKGLIRLSSVSLSFFIQTFRLTARVLDHDLHKNYGLFCSLRGEKL